MDLELLDAIENCFRPEIQIVSGLTLSEIETEIDKINQFNQALDIFLYGGGEEDFVEEIREILDDPLDDYLKVANANLELLWHG